MNNNFVLLLLTILIINSSLAKESTPQCNEDGATTCLELNTNLNDKITRSIKIAVDSYEACSKDANDVNCTCYAAGIKRDLAPYKSIGFSRQMLEDAAKYGTRYKIYGQKLFREENCFFPARCQGIEHFLLELLPQLPNMDLVINTRDYPQLHSSWSSSRIGPVFSFSKTSEYRDIMYPAWTFWAGGPATKLHPTGIGRWDLMSGKLKEVTTKIPWQEKEQLGFFRGSRTSDERDSLILLSRQQPQLVEAQYTKNQAWKSPKDTLDAPPAEEVSFENHCKYKYLFNFRGVAASFRLKHLFLCNSLVIHVGEEWQEFFYHQLKPWVHYVPLHSYPSQAEYVQLLDYFKNHDVLAQQIAQRGHDFIGQHLRFQDIKCYWRKLLKRYAKLFKYEIKPDPSLKRIGGGIRNEL
ncbi:O-glucosyltransferase rumi [Drosophila grimshawi]|uniref:GH18344 n=1 Tax=Drosophila grimshawi TaxID=7222 RepID=B4JSD0_DROGR|nr:O-glucosyltransferase rumi [Drosophila grimshawi]EDV94670.1 GH18344 [Drosophila grimshawi]